MLVINGKKEGFIGRDKVYIGRRNKSYLLAESVLANPFVVGVHGNRTEVIMKYKRWLWIEFWEKGEVYEEVLRIARLVLEGRKIKLACWCKPQACHGDIVKALVEWLIKEKPELVKDVELRA